MVKRYKDKEYDNPYADIKMEVPKAGKNIKSRKDYNRKNERKLIEQELEEFEEFIDPNVEVLR